MWFKNPFRPRVRIVTLRLSEEESLELAQLYDKYQETRAMQNRVRFSNAVRALCVKYAKEFKLDLEDSTWSYDTKNGYIDLKLPLP